MGTKYNQISQKNFILIISLVFLVLTIFLIKDIFGLLVYSLILSYFLYPLYKFYFQKFGNKRIAALFSLFTATIGIFIPIAFLTYFMALNLIKIVVQYRNFIENPEILNQIITQFLENILGTNVLNSINFSEIFTSFLLIVLEYSKNFFSSIPFALLGFFIILFITYYILIYNKKILRNLNEYIPLSFKKQEEIINNIRKNISVLFRGYFLTGLIQTFIAFIGYLVLGVPNLLIITFLTLIASLIPYVGTPIIWVPVSFYLILTGNQIGGVGLLAYGIIVISMIDNFLRPILMSNKDTIAPPLVFIGLIGGLFVFGLEGIVLGPIIISITAILLRYLRENYEVKEE